MRKIIFVIAIAAVAMMFGCTSGEVTSQDAKEWQNQGREPGDVATDPNGQPVDGSAPADGRTDR